MPPRKPTGSKLHPIFKLFTNDQVDYIQRASRMISWPVNLVDATIHIHPDAALSDVEQLTIRHLYSEYGFDTTYDTHATPTTKLFNPAPFKAPIRQLDIITEIAKPKPHAGMKFRDTRDPKGSAKEIFKEGKDTWQVMYTNSMVPNYTISKLSFEINLDRGIYVIDI